MYVSSHRSSQVHAAMGNQLGPIRPSPTKSRVSAGLNKTLPSSSSEMSPVTHFVGQSTRLRPGIATSKQLTRNLVKQKLLTSCVRNWGKHQCYRNFPHRCYYLPLPKLTQDLFYTFNAVRQKGMRNYTALRRENHQCFIFLSTGNERTVCTQSAALIPTNRYISPLYSLVTL